MKNLLLIIPVILTTACVNVRSGDVGMGMVLPKSAEKLEVPKDQQFLFSTPIAEPILPDYPVELIASKATANVCIEIIIDENGEVTHTVPLFDAPGCEITASSRNPLFVDASIRAIKQWQFSAAAICKFPTTAVKNDTCDGEGVVITTIPIKLAYTFSFSVKNKNPIVRSAKTKVRPDVN